MAERLHLWIKGKFHCIFVSPDLVPTVHENFTPLSVYGDSPKRTNYNTCIQYIHIGKYIMTIFLHPQILFCYYDKLIADEIIRECLLECLTVIEPTYVNEEAQNGIVIGVCNP